MGLEVLAVWRAKKTHRLLIIHSNQNTSRPRNTHRDQFFVYQSSAVARRTVIVAVVAEDVVVAACEAAGHAGSNYWRKEAVALGPLSPQDRCDSYPETC